jgi:TPR repeat protein
MIIMKRFLVLPIIFILLPGIPAFADFAKGRSAYESGDYATAFKEFNPLAEQGHGEAQYNLGMMYNDGQGVTQDYETAFKWFKLAAEHNRAVKPGASEGAVKAQEAVFKYMQDLYINRAMYNLGAMYNNGDGVDRDFVRAYMWMKIAASQGNENAVLGRDMIQTNMTPEEVEEAQELVRKCVAKNYKDC